MYRPLGERIYESLSPYRVTVPYGMAVPFGLDVPAGTEIRVSLGLFERLAANVDMSDVSKVVSARLYGIPVVIVGDKPADWFEIVVPQETGS